MKSGTCPKCHSSDVYHQTNGIYIPNTLGTFIKTASSNMGSKTDDYICANCGYIERYVDDKRKLQDVAKVWKKVN